MNSWNLDTWIRENAPTTFGEGSKFSSKKALKKTKLWAQRTPPRNIKQSRRSETGKPRTILNKKGYKRKLSPRLRLRNNRFLYGNVHSLNKPRRLLTLSETNKAASNLKLRRSNMLQAEDAIKSRNMGISAQRLNSPFATVTAQRSDSIVSAQECRSIPGFNMKSIMDSKSFTRADSSDDSGCFSNLSRQSTSFPDASSSGFGGEMDKNLAVKNISSTAPTCTGYCNACGHETGADDYNFCRNCKQKFKKEGASKGTLGEVKAYAQSIAQIVRKILPGQVKSEDKITRETDGQKEKIIIGTRSVRKEGPKDIVLHRYKTEITKGRGGDTLKKSMGRSVSFDEQIVTEADENGTKKLRSQDAKSRTSDSPAALHLGLAATRKAHHHDGSGKEVKTVIISDDDKPHKIEKIKRRVSRKGIAKTDRGKAALGSATSDHPKEISGHEYTEGRPPLPPTALYGDDESRLSSQGTQILKRSRVERARTDGDIRSNQQMLNEASAKKGRADDSKRADEAHQSGAKNSRTNTEDDISRRPPKAEKSQVPKILRQKVIHEGSPVDPPVNDKGKVDDTKARQNVLIRSATAPYKNIGPKKDIFSRNKSGSLDGSFKNSRSGTKLVFRANKASSMRKDSSLKERERQFVTSDVRSESFRDESTSGALALPKRRSSSFDAGKKHGTQRDEIHRSKSRARLGDHKASNDASVADKSVAALRSSPNKQISSPQTAPKTQVQRQGAPINGSVTGDSYQQRHLPVDTARYNKSEQVSKQVSYDHQIERVAASVPAKEAENSQNASIYSLNLQHYNTELEKQLTGDDSKRVSVPNEQHGKQPANNEYFYTDVPAMANNQLRSVTPLEKDGYQDDDENSAWYTDHQLLLSDEGLLRRRDRSHESKSSTSFHLMTTVKSSHSDVALMKHHGALERPSSRRAIVCSETDVDTGVIYHFAKRQTTRAHVPPYHDLTTGLSKNIYTMSGDVSTSESSNSAISMKSEVSENIYTGGFFKNDPFYDNDNSSDSSDSHLYFQTEGVTKQETSEDDIYTGGVFSTSQNTLSLGNGLEGDGAGHVTEALKDGSTNNSTRTSHHRMSRRNRCRPSVDIIAVHGTDCVGEFSFSENYLCNCSNNSSNWFGINHYNDRPMCSPNMIKFSDNSMYTDYTPWAPHEVKPYKANDNPRSSMDFYRYDYPDAGPGFLFPPPQMDPEESNTWYRGLFARDQHAAGYPPYADDEGSQRALQCRRQMEPENYTDAICPKYRNINNCNCTSQSPPPSALNTNNNHFEDFYTGCYGASNSPPKPYEQPHPIPTHSSQRFYDQSPPRYNQNNFYTPDDSYARGFQGMNPRPAHERPPEWSQWANAYEGAASNYTAPNPYTQNSPGYSQSRMSLYQRDNFHGPDSAWHDYSGPKESVSMGKVYEDDYSGRPTAALNSFHNAEQRERDSYFDYIGGKNPMLSSYQEVEDQYTFDPAMSAVRQPSPKRITEIKKVGGIVCRENVANRDDYAEDVNRDLEPTAWVPLNFRRTEDEIKHPAEMTNTNTRAIRNEVMKTMEMNNQAGRYGAKDVDDGAYGHGSLSVYDSLVARNKLRDMPYRSQEQTDLALPRTQENPNRLFHTNMNHHPHNQPPQPQPQHQQIKKSEHLKTTWMPPDQIPERARGKRVVSNGNNGNNRNTPTVLNEPTPTPPPPDPHPPISPTPAAASSPSNTDASQSRHLSPVTGD